MLQLKHTFHMGLFQIISLGGTIGLCILDCDLTMGLCLLYCGSTLGLCLPDGGCMLDFCLFDGLSGLGLILVCGNVSIPCQLPSVGVQGGLGHEHPLHGHIHVPLQSKHLIGQAGWIGPGGTQDCGLGEMLAASRVFNTVGGEGE